MKTKDRRDWSSVEFLAMFMARIVLVTHSALEDDSKFIGVVQLKHTERSKDSVLIRKLNRLGDFEGGHIVTARNIMDIQVIGLDLDETQTLPELLPFLKKSYGKYFASAN